MTLIIRDWIRSYLQQSVSAFVMETKAAAATLFSGAALFDKIVRHTYLPEKRQISYELRERGHNMTLITK